MFCFLFFPSRAEKGLIRPNHAPVMSYSRTPGTDGSGYTNLNVYYMNPWLQIVLWGNTSNMNFEFVGKVARSGTSKPYKSAKDQRKRGWFVSSNVPEAHVVEILKLATSSADINHNMLFLCLAMLFHFVHLVQRLTGVIFTQLKTKRCPVASP